MFEADPPVVNSKTAAHPLVFHSRIKSSGYGATHSRLKLGEMPKVLKQKPIKFKSQTKERRSKSAVILPSVYERVSVYKKVRYFVDEGAAFT